MPILTEITIIPNGNSLFSDGTVRVFRVDERYMKAMAQASLEYHESQITSMRLLSLNDEDLRAIEIAQLIIEN